MRKQEKQLFIQLCNFNSESIDEKLLRHASPEVLGNLFANRMQGVAYGILKNNRCLNLVDREFRNSLKSAYEQNIEKNRSYYICVAYISDLIKHSKYAAALLKGSILCGVYPRGYRTSNDIDLLVLPQDVTGIGKLLTEDGFIQGSIKNNEFVPAERKEIIESKMLRGETVPYVKEMNLNNMKYLEVDINFSLDYKNNESKALKTMMENLEYKVVNGIRIPTLCREDFFIHLCGHLYKEATTLPWIKMKRDMTLYKYSDIYMLLGEMNNKEIKNIFERAKKLEMEKVCAYAILQTIELFGADMPFVEKNAVSALKNDKDFLLKVIAPQEKKEYMYSTKETDKRFFMDKREKDLREVEVI